MKAPEIDIETVPIDDIVLDPNNLRKHEARNLNVIKASLQRFGVHRLPVVQRSTRIILIGNGQVMAMRDLGYDEVTIQWVDDDDTKAAMRAYADNHSGDTSEFDEDLLALTLPTFDPDFLDDMDFDLGDFIDSRDTAKTKEVAATEPPAKPVTKPGDAWTLGDHRLICGDATQEDTVRAAIDGAKVSAIFTDPPYGIAYQDVKKKHRKIANDDADPVGLVQDALDRVGLKDGAPVYVCCDWRSLGSMRAALKGAGHKEKAVIVWDKRRPAQQLDRYYKQHEFILYAGPYGGQKTKRGDVWTVPRQPSTVHPTQKPIELCGFAIKDATKKGEAIYDPFAGSGSTLIAAEQLGRRCIAIELDPGYCDVIVKRYEDATGKKAVHEKGAVK